MEANGSSHVSPRKPPRASESPQESPRVPESPQEPPTAPKSSRESPRAPESPREPPQESPRASKRLLETFRHQLPREGQSRGTRAAGKADEGRPAAEAKAEEMGSRRLGSRPGGSRDTPKTMGSGGPTTSPMESPHEVLERKPE